MSEVEKDAINLLEQCLPHLDYKLTHTQTAQGRRNVARLIEAINALRAESSLAKLKGEEDEGLKCKHCGEPILVETSYYHADNDMYCDDGQHLATPAKPSLPLEEPHGPCCRDPWCGGDCTCEICAPDLAIRDLKAELEAMIEDRNLWRDAHNDDCPNLVPLEEPEQIECPKPSVSDVLLEKWASAYEMFATIEIQGRSQGGDKEIARILRELQQWRARRGGK